MTALESSEGPGLPLLLTGVLKRTLHQFEPGTLLDLWTQVGL